MQYSIGIEFGSTRIKSSLINEKFEVIAQGTYTWESQIIAGNWTYKRSQILEGFRTCFNDLLNDYQKKFNKPLTELDSLGISAMMHGYLAFDKNNNLLVPFRTWRNTNTKQASEQLSKLFNFNIPQRWSIAHLYQAILNNERHVKEIAYITTLAGWITYMLTGKHEIGIGDASGMFPIDLKTKQYDKEMLAKFDKLIGNKYPWKLIDILPKIKLAGDNSSIITPEGYKFLNWDHKGKVVVCPAEGDAGTGMVCTNSVKDHTGNISAGTSAFAMIVTTKKLAPHREIDMVTTPTGFPVAMVHTNTCSSDINAWAGLFDEVLKLFGKDVPTSELMTKLFEIAAQGDKDGNRIVNYNYYGGEEITKLQAGKPMIVRAPDAVFNLANFMKTLINSSMATLKLGMDILQKEEYIEVDNIFAHGGIFKTPGIAQTTLSAALDVPISILTNAEEGGSYGMAILAMYAITKNANESLEDYLENRVFKDVKIHTVKANDEEIAGYDKFIDRYKRYLHVEKAAVNKEHGIK